MRTKALCIALGVSLLFSARHFQPVYGASFSFDLTEAIGSDFNNFPEAIVDLGVAFTDVESATMDLKGHFRPGLVTTVTIPPYTGPLLRSDTVSLLVRLGEVGSAWIEKDVYALQDLQGHDGDVSFSLGLKGAVPTSDFVLLPGGDLAPDYGFLRDGRLGIATGPFRWLASIYQELEAPRFEMTEFILRIEGTAVPEPMGGSCALAAIGGAIIGTRRCQTRCYR
jgi:hypothetical protein